MDKPASPPKSRPSLPHPEALEFFIHRGDATGSEESVKLSLSLMGLNDADVESEFVEHVADNGGEDDDRRRY